MNLALEITCPTCRAPAGAGCVPLTDEVVVPTHFARRMVETLSPRARVARVIRAHLLRASIRCTCGASFADERSHVEHVAAQLDQMGLVK